MQRRDFIKLLGLSGVSLAIPRWSGASPNTRRYLIVIELKGGNDGLNTVVPYADSNYYRLRPNLAVARDKVVQLDHKLGLHPSLSDLMPLWRDKQLAIVQGVGYANPNLSHFRSIEIWDTGSDSNEYLDAGWLSQLLNVAPKNENRMADGIVIGQGTGPLMGNDRTLNMQDPQRFLRQAGRLTATVSQTDNPALQHILDTQNRVHDSAQQLATRLHGSRIKPSDFPRSPIGRQLAVTTQIINAQIPTAVIKVGLGGFDTHTNQAGAQQRLLGQLSKALIALRKSLQQNNKWDEVMVMTYSEFGRRVAENGNRGTDHGTAAPQFFMGGGVKGGLYGKTPSLGQLDDGNLRHHVDFRRLYSTVAHWWGIKASANPFGRYPGIDLLG